MKGRIEQIALVRRDLLVISTILGRTSRRSAELLLAAVEGTFRQIADMPGPGEPYESEEVEIPGIRRCLVTGYKNYLVYYVPIAGGVRILRVVKEPGTPADSSTPKTSLNSLADCVALIKGSCPHHDPYPLSGPRFARLVHRAHLPNRR